MGKKRDAGLQAAIDAAGTRYRLSKLLGLSTTAVINWKQIPLTRVLDVERVTKVDREILRPDLFRR